MRKVRTEKADRKYLR